MKKNSILLKNIQLDKKNVNILIEGNLFKSLNAAADAIADEVVDCSGLAILPAFYNAHTHAAMTLLRGYADDMPLFTWLNDYIWPFEATLTSEDIRQSSYLAVLEMIKGGTVFFNDMYWDVEQTIEAADKLGVRAEIGVTFMDIQPDEVKAQRIKFAENWSDTADGRIKIAIAPHAIYTVGKELFTRCADMARQNGHKLHFHLSETEQEVKDCLAAHGTTPVRLLKQWGVLDDNCVAAHVVHVDDDEIKMLADSGVTVVHNPCSNMKLGSGIFPSLRMMAGGVNVTLGTDGCSSNNNLSMLDEMKTAALLAKLSTGPDKLSMEEVMKWATVNGAKAFGIDSGVIEEGKIADAVLVNLNDVHLLPCHNLLSNWVYSADTRCIDSVICDGRIIMRGGRVEGEEDIIENFKVHLNNR